jgi:hypothetical protein
MVEVNCRAVLAMTYQFAKRFVNSLFTPSRTCSHDGTGYEGNDLEQIIEA